MTRRSAPAIRRVRRRKDLVPPAPRRVGAAGCAGPQRPSRPRRSRLSCPIPCFFSIIVCPLERLFSDQDHESPYCETVEPPPGAATATLYRWNRCMYALSRTHTLVNPTNRLPAPPGAPTHQWMQASLKRGFNQGVGSARVAFSGPYGPASFAECDPAKPIVRISRKPGTGLTRKEAAGNCPPPPPPKIGEIVAEAVIAPGAAIRVMPTCKPPWSTTPPPQTQRRGIFWRGCGPRSRIRPDPALEGLRRGPVTRMAWAMTRKVGPPCELRAFLGSRKRCLAESSSGSQFGIAATGISQTRTR